MIESLQSVDRSLFLFLNSLHTPFLNPIMSIISGQIIWLPFVIYFFYYSNKHFGKKETIYFGLFLALVLIASDVTSSYVLKNIVNRLRPCRELDLKLLIHSFGQKCGGKYGFVSSHAANSLALVVFSLSTLFADQKKYYFLLIIPILVGFSRIYLGVHYPGDIVGGMLIGTIWSLTFAKMFKSSQGARRESSHEPFFIS